MSWTTLASVEDVRNIGNISERVSEKTLKEYLEMGSYILYAIIGATNYSGAQANTLDSPQPDMLKKAEACIAVSLGLPAVSLHLSEMGAVKQMAMARGGEYQSFSYAKEIAELAGAFYNLARTFIPAALVVNESMKAVWYQVAMVLFPSLDEYPTVAPIKSWAETLIKEERGDVTYDGKREGVD